MHACVYASGVYHLTERRKKVLDALALLMMPVNVRKRLSQSRCPVPVRSGVWC